MEPQFAVWKPGSYLGATPFRVNQKTGKREIRVNRHGHPVITTESGLTVNSQLRRDEWQLLDRKVVEAAKLRLAAVQDLKDKNLVVPIGSFGTLTSQWNLASELTDAQVSMTGQGLGERDRVEFLVKGVPLPIFFKDFVIPKRQLEAARLLNNQLDTTHASLASRVVSEKLEDTLINGFSTIVFDGNTIYGYTTEPNRKTDTAANLGGGDWGTISNIIPTVSGMINMLSNATNRYHGPFMLYANTVQYNEATTVTYSDGSGHTPAQRILQMPQVGGFKQLDMLAAGSLILAQMTEDVVDWAEHLTVTVLEWVSGDGMVTHFKVIAVAAPRVKSEYEARSGIAHVTGA